MYMPKPCQITILQAEEIPPHGGDTIFADQVAASDSLSEGLKTTLQGLRCLNSSSKSSDARTREDYSVDDIEAVHPAVMVHPETGRKSLYLSEGHTEFFDGWNYDDSGPLLQYLHRHQTRLEFTCRVKWEEGTIVMWDNFQVQHNPVNDYYGYRRRMLRITLARG